MLNRLVQVSTYARLTFLLLTNRVLTYDVLDSKSTFDFALMVI